MNKYYIERLDKIEEQIKSILPENVNKEWIEQATGLKDTDIDIEAANIINQPCAELIFRGGKRWRPLIIVLLSTIYNKGLDISYKLSPLVELIHNGTLLVDDIEDKAIERRGKPAVHLIYGEDMAINSGNHLYYMPTMIIDQLELESDIKLRIYRSYTHNMRRLHFGQGLDIQWHNNLSYIPTVNQYIQMCKFKTGCLASMAGELGAIISGLNINDTETIREIFEEIGVSFQIMDDIKNITTGNPGKHRGDDIVEGKKSLPVILYSHKYDNSLLLKNILKAKKYGINKGKKYIESAIKLLEDSGVIQQSKDMALDFLNVNIEKLNSILPESEAKRRLIDLLIGFTSK